MPAGCGKRCSQCYWVERCERGSTQLVELLKAKRVRDAFIAFAAWLQTQVSAQRSALRLRRHVEFFEMLDRAGGDTWTSEFLLKEFGTATLRKYELPVRWLRLQTGVALSEEDKSREADGRRVRNAISSMPEGTAARELLGAFQQELERRRAAGKLTERSMRLAFRPAAALLKVEDPQGSRPPSQSALEQYLKEVPGQRAALSTFVGFLKASQQIELRMPPKPAASSVLARKALEKQIAALMAQPVDAALVAKRWTSLALRYFHHLSASDANTVCNESTHQQGDSGTVLVYRGQEYWIPAEPMTLSPYSEARTHGLDDVGAGP